MLNMYRVDENKKIAGVCTGLAKSFDMDLSIIRVLFGVSMIALNGFGFWLYLALVILMPVLPEGQEVEKFDSSVINKEEVQKYAGIGLVLFGAYAVINNLNVYWLQWANYNNLWPIVLVAVGLVMLKNVVRDDKEISKEITNE